MKQPPASCPSVPLDVSERLRPCGPGPAGHPVGLLATPVRQFRERGCTIISIKESWLNGSAEVQDVLVAFAGWMAQQESTRRRERVKAGVARDEGKKVGGRKPGSKDKPGSARSEANKAAWARRKAAAAAQG
jgi:DNA invertase Pin-like site-specific DNA recombinase